MRAVHAERALTPQGWARDVRIVIADDGRIASLETGAEAQAGDERLIARALLPAPANLHSHSFQRAMAGMTEARGADPQDSFWTWRALMYRFLERLTPDHIEAIAGFAFMEMLEAGFGSVAEFHYVHLAPGGAEYDDPGETSARVAAASAAAGIGLTLLPVLYTRGGVDGRELAGGQKRFGRDLDHFAKIVTSARGSVAAAGADAKIGVAPHSLRAVSAEDLAAAPDLAAGGPIHIHIAEQEREVEEVTAAMGARPVEWLLGAAGVDARWCLVHATHMTEEEARSVAASGATVGLAPITEANLGDGVFGGPEYIEAGGRFGVGTDSNVRISLAEELRTLEYSQRLAFRRRAVMAGPQASAGRFLFDMACAGGAAALGRDCGALAPGNWADMAAIDLNADAIAGLDGDAALDAWIFASGDGVVRDVWSAGRHQVREGRHVAREALVARYRATLGDLRRGA